MRANGFAVFALALVVAAATGAILIAQVRPTPTPPSAPHR